MGTFEDIFHITLFSNNSDILEIFAGTVLTLCFYKYKQILQRQSLKLSIFVSIVLPDIFFFAYNNSFLSFFPNAYNKLHGFYYTYVKVAIETILLPHKCFVKNILSNKASCYETYAFAFYVALFVKIDVSVQIIQIKKGS